VSAAFDFSSSSRLLSVDRSLAVDGMIHDGDKQDGKALLQGDVMLRELAEGKKRSAIDSYNNGVKLVLFRRISQSPRVGRNSQAVSGKGKIELGVVISEYLSRIRSVTPQHSCFRVWTRDRLDHGEKKSFLRVKGAQKPLRTNVWE
jgi:hypothetical protein